MISNNTYTVEFYKNQFISELGFPNSEYHLDEYFNLIFNTKLQENLYSEIHHILPKCKFKQFIRSNWNLIRLNQPIHKKAHVLLAEAYNINEFINPLRFMNENISFELISNARKLGWKKLKNNEENYKSFCKKRSEIETKNMLTWKSKYLNNLFLNSIEAREKHKIAVNNSWTEERKQSHSNKLKKLKSDPIVKEKISKTSKEVWDNKTIEQREIFNDTMKLVNNCPEKIKKSAEKNKANWENPEFRKSQIEKKQKTRQENISNGKILKTNSEALKQKWKDPVWKEEILKRRKEKRNKNETK